MSNNNEELSAGKVGELAQAAAVRTEVLRYAVNNAVYSLASKIVEQPLTKQVATPEQSPEEGYTIPDAQEAVRSAIDSNVPSYIDLNTTGLSGDSDEIAA